MDKHSKIDFLMSKMQKKKKKLKYCIPRDEHMKYVSNVIPREFRILIKIPDVLRCVKKNKGDILSIMIKNIVDIVI